MSLVINTNVASLSAQNSIGRAQMDQNEAMERLTTGKRINTAADDAAGLAIANKMTSQVKGLNQAVRNANDGISMLQTAAGGLEESNNILQRMRELAVQSASGTYDEGNRASMDAEVTQLKAELDRIAETTTFNGQKILDGSRADVSLQVGANANETIDFGIDSTKSKDLGGSGADITGTTSVQTSLHSGLAVIENDGEMEINGQAVKDLSNETNVKDQLDLITSSISGVTAGVLTEWTADAAGDGVLSGTNGLLISVSKLDSAPADYATNANTFRITDTGNMQELVDKINAEAGDFVTASVGDDGKLTISSTVTASMTITGTNAINAAAGYNATVANDALGDTSGAAVTQTGQLTLDSDTGEGITVTYTDTADVDDVGVNISHEPGAISGMSSMVSGSAAAQDIEAGDITINGVALGEFDASLDHDSNGTPGEVNDIISWINTHTDQTGVIASLTNVDGIDALQLKSISGDPVSLDYKDATVSAAMETKLGLQETNAAKFSGGSVDGISVATASDAQKAIGILDDAIEQVSKIQGELGAVNNRLDFTVNNLSNVSENASAAKSRIEDADFAAESANLSRAQVLQQAGQAMLAQANSAPQQVLSLLQ